MPLSSSKMLICIWVTLSHRANPSLAFLSSAKMDGRAKSQGESKHQRPDQRTLRQTPVALLAQENELAGPHGYDQGPFQPAENYSETPNALKVMRVLVPMFPREPDTAAGASRIHSFPMHISISRNENLKPKAVNESREVRSAFRAGLAQWDRAPCAGAS